MPCQPAVRAYVGPRVSYLRIRSGTLIASVNEGTGEVTESLETVRQNATMGGVQAGVWYRAAGKIFEQLEGYWEQGDPRNRQDLERNRRWERWEVTGRIGATAGVGCYCAFLGTPYAGYGFRWFKDEFRREDITVETPGGPVEVTLPKTSFYYSTYYVPLGGMLSLTLGNCIEVGVTAEYQTPVQSRLKVQVEGSTEGANSQCRWRLPRKGAWLVEVPIRVRLGPCCVQMDLSLVPYYKDERYGSVEITDLDPIITDAVQLPERRQITAGLRLELGLRI